MQFPIFKQLARICWSRCGH